MPFPAPAGFSGAPPTFVEIDSFDGTKDTAVPRVIFLRAATCVTVTDENPLPGGAFYRFEARLEP